MTGRTPIHSRLIGNGPAQIVQKLWNYCNVLRDAGLSYGDYLEQLTYLLFLKMAKVLADSIPKAHTWLPESTLAPGVRDWGRERAGGCILM